MYISRVEIDRYNRQKMKKLNQLGSYHNWVESMFPEEIEEKVFSRKLWRIDKLYGDSYLIVVSDKSPDLSKMTEFGVEETASSREYTDYLNSLEEGQVLRFKVTLNPVISKSTGKKSGERGKVIPLNNNNLRHKFLIDKADKHGFSVSEHDFIITDSRYSRLKKKGSKPVNVLKVTYEGQLRITNIELFRKSLISGIGKKKAYGCGLLTVIPIKNEC